MLESSEYQQYTKEQLINTLFEIFSLSLWGFQRKIEEAAHSRHFSMKTFFSTCFGTAKDHEQHKASSIKKEIIINNSGLVLSRSSIGADTFITQQTVSAPINITHNHTCISDGCEEGYLSSSDSSTDSTSSTLSNMSSSSNNNDTMASLPVYQPHRHHRNSASSITTLSEILCEYYAKKNSGLMRTAEVPLGTEIVLSPKDRSIGLVRSQFVWNNPRLGMTKEWDEKLFLLSKEDLADENKTIKPNNHLEIKKSKKPMLVAQRGVRTNPDHLRIIVAEVNMMRADKIVSPLRPREFLLAKTKPFVPNLPSLLRG